MRLSAAFSNTRRPKVVRGGVRYLGRKSRSPFGRCADPCPLSWLRGLAMRPRRGGDSFGGVGLGRGDRRTLGSGVLGTAASACSKLGLGCRRGRREALLSSELLTTWQPTQPPQATDELASEHVTESNSVSGTSSSEETKEADASNISIKESNTVAGNSTSSSSSSSPQRALSSCRSGMEGADGSKESIIVAIHISSSEAAGLSCLPCPRRLGGV
mmetsp:Transcript_30838/g.88654  ORF Transcript_30838/g.88654 Transcript_30838/m.88654 type:complete len:215 (-) Transcript_30838:695-1339(-)